MRSEPKSAPPDDGGTQGSFTRPEDAVVYDSSEFDPRVEVGPDQITSGQSLLAAWLFVPFVLLTVVMFVYCAAPTMRSGRDPRTPMVTD